MGYIAESDGAVLVANEKGEIRTAQVGAPLFLNETVVNDSAANVVIELVNNQLLYLSSQQQIVLNLELFGSTAAGNTSKDSDTDNPVDSENPELLSSSESDEPVLPEPDGNNNQENGDSPIEDTYVREVIVSREIDQAAPSRQPTEASTKSLDFSDSSNEPPPPIEAVTQINLKPEIVNQSFSVDEGVASDGSVIVGNVISRDPEGQELHYTIIAENEDGKFTINPATGEITVTGDLDFETRNLYNLTVEATDAGNLSESATVTISVNDVNEAPELQDQTYSIDENVITDGSQVVGTITGTDTDAGQTLTYTITAGNDDNRFAIDPNSGEITVINGLDHESTDSYQLTVTATDDGIPSSSTSAQVTININDLNEAPTVTAPASASYTEGGTVNLLNTLTLDDPEGTLESATVQFTEYGKQLHTTEDQLSFTNQSGISGSYDAANGVLTLTGTASVADYQAALRSITYTNLSDAPDTDSRILSVSVNDGFIESNVGSTTLSITADNDAPVITGAGDLLGESVDTANVEGLAQHIQIIKAGTAHSFVAGDQIEVTFTNSQDASETYTVEYTVGSNTAAHVIAQSLTHAIINSTPGIGSLVSIVSEGGSVISSDYRNVIGFDDPNQPPFNLSTVIKNSADQVVATGASMIQNTTHVYGVNYNGAGTAGTAQVETLTIPSPLQTGQTVKLFINDFELSHTVTAGQVTTDVRDALLSQFTDYDLSQAVSAGASGADGITLTSEQPGEPFDAYGVTTSASDLFTLAVNENTNNGTIVGTVGAEDRDGDSDTLTYTLTDDAGGRFTIDSSTGEITVAGALDHESAASHTVTVRVTDAQSAFSEQQITIQVNDSNDAPTVADQTLTTDEDTALLFTAADFSISDQDASDTHTVTIEAINGSGSLYQAPRPDLEFLFEETSGTTTTDDRNSTQGTLSNVTWSNEAGRGGFVTFDQNTDHITLSQSFDLGSEWTVATEFRNLRTDGNGYHSLAGSDSDVQIVVQSGTGEIGTWQDSVGFHSTGVSLNGISADWHSLVVVGQNGQTDFYLDNTLLGSASYQSTGEIDTVGNNSHGNDQAFAENLNNFRIYNVAHPPVTAPSVELSFDDSANPLTDSGNGVTGTVSGAQVVTDTERGSVLEFDNSSDTALLTTPHSLSSEWTISTQFKDLSSATWKTLARGSTHSHHIIIDSSGELGVFDGGSNSVGYTGTGFIGSGFDTSALDNNAWHSLTAVGKDGKTHFYIDGAYVGTSDFQVTENVYSIGNYQSGTQPFATYLDDFTIVDTAQFPGTGTALPNGSLITAGDVINAEDLNDLRFIPNPDENGSNYASIDFKATDNNGADSTTETLTINVTAVSEAPTASDKTLSINEDNSHTFNAADFSFSDADAGDTLQSVTITQLPSAGTLTLSGANVTANQVIPAADIGNLVFTPVTHANGTGYTDIQFTVSDGALSSEPHTFTIDVTAVNDAPVLEATLDTAVSPEGMINTVTGSDQSEAVLTPMADGGYLAAWHSEESGSHAIKAQRYSVQATSRNVTIADHSFESVTLIDGEPVLNPAASPWSFSSTQSGIWNPTSGQITQEAPDGNNIGYATNDNETLSQTLSESFSNDTQYQLQVEIGNRSDTAGFADYEVRITAGGVVLASDGSVSPAEGQWQTLTLNLDGSTIPANSPAIGQPITIELVKISGPQIHFDNVRMTATSNELQPDGAEFQVDTTTLVDDQFVQHPQVATLENGNYAVAWEIFDPNSFAKTNMRIFAADGSEVKSEFEILTTSGSHYKPDIIALSNDRFLVTNVHSLDVKATILDENGNSVSTSTAGNVGGWQWGGPEATALNNGGFALAWRLSGTTADDSARIQFFDSNGNNTTSEISFGGAINDSDPHFEIDTLSNGEVVTVYQSGENLFFQRWSDTGTAQGSAVQINTSVSPDINGVSEASIETLSDGGFFVVWRSTSQDSSASHGVYGRRFDASGNPLTDEIAINTTTAGNQFDPSVIELDSGALQVVWTSNQDGNENIYGASIGLGGNQVLENAPYGTLVGRATATDVEDGTTLTYELVNDAGGRFAIDSTTGAITVSNASLLDHDTADAHTIRVRATDSGGLTAEQDIVIQVRDTNEAPQDITLTLDAGVVSSTPEAQATWAFDNNYDNEAGGNTFSGATPTFVAGPNSRFSNAIEFDGSATDFTVPLDVSETAYTVSFWFKADNAGGLLQIQNSGTDGHDRNILLNADGTITSRIWTEESITSPVGEIYNDGQWHHVVHTFGTSISGQALYVDGTQVATGSKTSSDFTSQTQLRLGFSSSGGTHLDGAIAGLQVFNQAVTSSQVADLLAGANGADAIVDEDTNTATIIGTLATTDPDDAAEAFGQHSYSVSDSRFEISGNQLQLKAGQSLDYETEPTISVTVTATDDNGNGLSTSKTFTIQVRDSNEAPTVADQTFTINEDSQYNLKASDFSIADQDAGDTHTVTITAINGSGTLMKQPRPDLELLFEDDNTATSAYDGRNDIRGNLTGVTWGTDAEKGGIATFDQNSDRINLTQAYDLGSEWTITTEFRNLRSDGTTWQSLVEGNGDVQILISQSTGEIGTWQNGVGFHGTGFTVSGLGNTWHSLTAIGRDGKTHFYMDDEYLGTANYQSTSSIETIGNNSVANSQAFAEELNDFRIYNSANIPDLDLSQIAEANTPELSLTFTDQTDSVNDIANNIRGTATAGVEWQNDAQQGPVLRFDNENDYLTLDNDFAVGSEWTISTRFKNPLPLGGNGDSGALVRSSAGDQHVMISSSGELGVLDRQPSNIFHGSGFTISSLDSNWHDLTAVGSNGKTYFYIDNQLVGVSNFQATEVIDNIGGDDSTFVSPFAEFIDDFQIHDQAFFGDLGDIPPGTTTVNTNDTIPAEDLNDLIFVPDAHASGNAVASIDFKATDNGGLESSTETLTFNITPITDAPVITLNNDVYSNLQLDTELVTNGDLSSTTGWQFTGTVGIGGTNQLSFSSGDGPNDGVAENNFVIHPDVNYTLSLDFATSGSTTPQSGLVEIVDISTGNVLASQSINTNTGTYQALNLNFSGISAGHATLRITDTSTATSSVDLRIDNISIQAAAGDNSHIPTGIGVFGQEDQPVAVNLNAVTPDADGSETFTVQLTGIPSGIALSDGSNNITATGAAIDVSAWNLSNLTFTSPANTSDDFTFTVTATATETATGTPETTSQAVNVHIQSINDIPVSADNTVTITEDNSHTFTSTDFAFTDNDTGDSLQSITITSLPALGTLELNSSPVTLNQVINTADIGNLVYTPVPEGNGTGYSSFNFTVSDGTESSSAQTMTFDVTAVNDAPVFDPAAASLTRTANTQPVGNGDTFVTLNSHANDFAGMNTGAVSMWVKLDSGQTSAALFSTGDASSATTQSWLVAGNSTSGPTDESLTFFSRVGDNLFNMRVRQGEDLLFDDQWHHIAVVVDGIDNRIYIDGQQVAVEYLHGSATTSQFTGADTDLVNVGAIVRNGELSGSFQADGEIADVGIFSDTSDLTDTNINALMNQGPEYFDSSQLLFSTDFAGTGNTVTDTSGNGRDGTAFTGNLAVRSSVTILDVDEDNSQVLQKTDILYGFSDADDDTLSIQSLSVDTGTITDNGNDTWTYTPPANFHGTATFTIEVSDGALSVTANKTITVTSINDIPTSLDKTVTINEDNSHTFSTTDFAFSDQDSGDSLQSITITSLPAAGTLELNTNPVTLNQVITAADISNLVFTPVVQASGTGYASFGFTVSDGTDSSTAQTLTLDVTPVTDTTTVTLNNNIIDTNVVQNGDVSTTDNWSTSGAIVLTIGHLQLGAGSANSDGIAEQEIYLNDGLDYSISLDYYVIGSLLTESALIEVIDSATGSTLFSQSVSSTSTAVQTLNANFTTTSAGFATLRISDTSSGSQPSTDLGIDNISLIPEAANNAGYTPTVSVPEDQPVPIELDIANPDTDGSETLVVQLTGIPSGIQLSDGTNNFTSTGVAIDVSSWNLNNLVLTPPANYDNDFTMTATATATETATGTQVVTNQAINIHIQDINAPPVITALNPVTDVDAAFSFSEGTGTTAADISGNSQDLSMSGSATWGTSRSGSGTAFEMNGTSGAGEISGLQTGGEMTIAAWVRFDSFTQSWSRVVDFGDGQGDNNILIGHETTTGNLGFHVEDSSGTFHTMTVSNFFTAGEWVHMAATIDSTGLYTVYKNGEQVGTLQGGVPTEKVRNFNYVGKSNWSVDGYLDGAIDDLAVIRGALDATAVSNLYQASELSDFVDANFVIDENSSNGTVVAQLSANDEEDGTNVTYSLVNNAGGRFAISSTGEITVADSSLLDHETTGSHTLRIRVTDSGGLTDEQDVVIQIADINEAPTAIVETSADNPNIPNLTSNNDHGFIVSASGEHSASYAAFRAFDGVDASSADNTGSWAVNGSTGWLQVDTGSPTAIWKYDLKAIGLSIGREPEDWQLQGSNDGINFDVIDTQSGINNWTVREVKEFELTTPAMYRYYRLNITDNNGDSFTGLDGFQIHQDITLTDQNTPLTLDVLANDIDQDDTDDTSNFSLDSVVIVDGSDNPVTGQGTATVVNNEIQFDPGSDFAYLADGENTTVNLRYTMSDDEGVTSTVTTTITVNGINDAPVIDETMNTLDVNAAYTFTEGSGTTAADHSGDNQPLTLSGSASWGTSRAGSGTAFEMDGTSGSGEISGLQTGGEMTISTWVRYDSFSQSWSRIIDFGDGAGSENILLAHIGTTSDLGFHVIDSGGTTHALNISNFFTAGEWVHITATVDSAGLMTVYKDGVEAGSLQGVVPTDKVRTFNYVGRSNWSTDGFLDGAIDDLIILNESVDATEANNLFQATQLTDILLDIDEHSADNTVVGTVPATELDTSDTLTYTLLDDAGGRFAINSSNGEITVADSSLLDFDDNIAHKVRVRVTDDGNPSLSDEQDVTIVVNNINEIDGTSAADTLTASASPVILRGLEGNDILTGWSGDDILLGGSGDDVMTGGTGRDEFRFEINDIGTAINPAEDTIIDFNTAENDTLNLADLLIDEENNDLSQYISFDSTDPSNPIVEVRDTAGGDITQRITLQGVDLSLMGNTDAEIINNLLNNGNLNTD